MILPDLELWRALERRIAEAKGEKQASLCGGACKTIEQYREEVGFIAGLDFVLEAAKDALAEIGGRTPRP